MQQVVIAKPYEFAPPHHGTFWPWLLHTMACRVTLAVQSGVSRGWNFTAWSCLQASLRAGHGVILAPNHCRPCDAFMLTLLGAELRQPF